MGIVLGLPIFAAILLLLVLKLPSMDFINIFHMSNLYLPLTEAMADKLKDTPINLTLTLLTIILVLFLIFLISAIVGLFKGNFKKLLNFINYILITLSLIIICISIIWLPNYKYSGLKVRLNIENRKLSGDELKKLGEYLVEEAKGLRKTIDLDKVDLTNKEAEDLIYSGFESFLSSHGEARYNIRSLREFPLGDLMKYTGIVGFYNPLTAEANYNGKEPTIFRYSTMLHELSHSYGFAIEREAGALSYMASVYIDNSYIKYSSTMDALVKVLKELKNEDIRAYKEINDSFSKEMIGDLEKYWDHYRSYEGPLKEMSDKVNDTFLKANGQDGLDDYNKVAGYIYDFLKKEKRI